MTNERRLGWTLAAVGMLLVSTDSLWIRLSRGEAWDIALLVAAFSLPVFLVLNRLLEETGPVASLLANPIPITAAAVLTTISHVSFITAVTRTAVANVVVIVAATPLMAAVVARLTLREQTARRVWYAIALTTVGIVLVVGGSLGQPNLAGDLLALTAVAAFATGLSIWRRYPELSRYVVLALSSAIVVAVALPFAPLRADPLGGEPRLYLAAAAMGLVFSPAGRICHASAPRFAPAAEVALFAPVETVAATIWALVFFSEVPRGRRSLAG